MKKIIETINIFQNDGIIKTIHDNLSSFYPDDVNTIINSTNVDSLDYEYYLQHSGDKYISLLYERMLDAEEKEYITSAITEMAKMIIVKYYDNWLKLYNSIYADYNPIENYSMVENEGVNTNTTISSSQDNNRFALGTTSADGSPNDKISSSVTTSGDAEYNNRELKRSGNIGVTTSQQMIESEIELRKKNFYDIMYNDIDSILCNQLYY